MSETKEVLAVLLPDAREREEGQRPSVVTLLEVDGNHLRSMYEQLRCSCIDVLRGERFHPCLKGLDLIIDDEGLMVADPVPNGWLQNIAGRVLIARADKEGNTVSLTFADAFAIGIFR